MKIIDLTPEYESLYFLCLEDWSDDMKEAGDHKACWYHLMKDKGLKVKLVRDENGAIVGMIQYLPVEHSFIEGNDLYFVLCIWIHGHKPGVGNCQKKGLGKALLIAAEEDVMNTGAKGLAAWGINLPFWMKASWFRKQGYQVVDKDGMMRLLWKPLSPDAVQPSFIKQKKLPPLEPGKVNISLFLNGWCPAQNLAYERTKRAIKDFGDKIKLNEFNTIDKDVQKEWGISDAVLINNKHVRNGPPPTYKKIRRLVEKKVRKIK